MFQNPYMPNYYNNNFNQQSMNDRIDNQIAQLNQMKEQINKPMQQPVPTNLTQNFQLAPNSHNGMKYVNTMEDVAKEQVFIDTPFFSKDMSVLWVKDNKGNIKSYELKEIMPLDEKDMKINFLMAQIEELKKEMKTNESNANVDEPSSNTIESEEPANVSTVSKPKAKSKQSTGDTKPND